MPARLLSGSDWQVTPGLETLTDGSAFEGLGVLVLEEKTSVWGLLG